MQRLVNQFPTRTFCNGSVDRAGCQCWIMTGKHCMCFHKLLKLNKSYSREWRLLRVQQDACTNNPAGHWVANMWDCNPMSNYCVSRCFWSSSSSWPLTDGRRNKPRVTENTSSDHDGELLQPSASSTNAQWTHGKYKWLFYLFSQKQEMICSFLVFYKRCNKNCFYDFCLWFHMRSVFCDNANVK